MNIFLANKLQISEGLERRAQTEQVSVTAGQKQGEQQFKEKSTKGSNCFVSHWSKCDC